MSSEKLLSTFWLSVWAFALSLGWLLPNHYAPWSSFHADAWVAFVLLCAGWIVIAKTWKVTSVYGFTALVAFVALTPFIQFVAGMHAFAGPPWIVTAYLSGFLLALLIGARWERASPGEMADGLFLAIGIAAVVSVGLQLHQWLSLNILFIWDMGNSTTRPFANFGQPNMLATFLLWAVLGAAWGLHRKYIGPYGALTLTLYLLFGVALTGSRTAWLAVAMVVAFAWIWRRLLPNRWLPWITTGLGAYFWGCVIAKDWVLRILHLDALEDLMRLEGETRLQVWKVLFEAALLRPFTGYGWNQIALAHVEVAADNPPFYMLYAHSHNLFLDLILWCGIPLGLLLGGAMLWWIYSRFKAVKRLEEALLFMMVMVVANHSLLEYPLAYAYLLLPVGLVMGILDVRLAAPLFQIPGRWPAWSLAAALTLLLPLLVRDYLRVEASYLAFRFEQARIQIGTPKGAPDVLMLTDLRDMIRYFRYEPRRNMPIEELDWMRSVARLYPSAGIIHKLAAALAWNQQPEESSLWLKRLCKMVRPEECEAVKRFWARMALTDPEIRAIPWPEANSR